MAEVAARPEGESKPAQHKEVPPPDVGAVRAMVHAYMYAKHSPQADQILEQLESKTSLDRDQLAGAFGVVIAFYLVFGNLAATLCNIIGFAYPSYVSVKAIRTEDKDDDTKWLIYWTVFGFFSVIDTFAEVILQYCPFYYLLKAAFLLFLYLPQTNGAEYIYHTYVDGYVTAFDAWLSGESAPAASAAAAAEGASQRGENAPPADGEQKAPEGSDGAPPGDAAQ